MLSEDTPFPQDPVIPSMPGKELTILSTTPGKVTGELSPIPLTMM